MPLLAALANPHMSLMQLQVCLDYMIVSLCLEDLTDFAASMDARDAASTFMGLFEGFIPAPEAISSSARPIFDVVRQLLPGIMKGLGATYQRPFIKSNVLLAKGMVEEATQREEAVPSHGTVEDYIRVRRTTIGIEPVLILGQWARNIDLPEEILRSEHVGVMVEATIDMVFLANDIYSYKKERQAQAAQHNIITIALREGIAAGYQGCVDYANQLIQAAALQFEQGLLQLEASAMWAEHGDNLQKYAENMMDWVVGNIEWSLQSERYSLFADKEASVARIVQFDIV
ncbi:hypothetical protein HGRIS_014262 [Hohenbuehelia grisea]